MTETTDTLLLNILSQVGDLRQEIGSVSAKLESGAELHKTFAQQLDMIDRRTDIIEDKTVAIEAIMTPKDGPALMARITALEVFQGKMGATLLVASTIVGAAFWFIWEGIKYFKPDVRLLISRFFH